MEGRLHVRPITAKVKKVEMMKKNLSQNRLLSGSTLFHTNASGKDFIKLDSIYQSKDDGYVQYSEEDTYLSSANMPIT